MSGPGNQSSEGGEHGGQQGGHHQGAQGGQSQGGQARGGQPQGGPAGGGQQARQPQGGYGQAPRRGPPGGAGESAFGALKRPVPKSFLKGIVVAMTLGSVLLSVLSALVGKLGGFTLLPGAVSFAQQMAGAAGTGGTTGTGTGTGGAAANPVSTAISTTHDALMAYLSTELAPFVVFVLAVLFGAVVAVRMDETLKPKLATASVGVLVGSFLFVLIVGFVASIVAPSVPPSLQQQAGFGVGGAAGGGQLSALGQLQMTNLLVNAVLVAILAAVTAAATTYSTDRFFPA